MLVVTLDKAKLQRVMQKLAGFKRSVRKRILKKAVRAAGRVGVKAAKAMSVKNSGVTRRGMTQRVISKKTGTAIAIIGSKRQPVQMVKMKNRWSQQPVRHKASKTNHLVNDGVKPHYIQLPNGGLILHSGIQPRRYMQKAAALASTEASNAFFSKSMVEMMAQAAKDIPNETDDGN